MAESLAGKTLGKYQIIEELGRGGMARVYKAYQPTLDRYVAIKVLHDHLIEGKNFLERFQREARAAAGLRNANIVQVFDFDVQDGTYFMVMEYIPGETLKDKLVRTSQSGGCLSLVEALEIFRQIAGALSYAHKNGMLHRDIKPSNILMDSEGSAYLADFGIARIISEKSITMTGALIGTPEYMSPEQALGNPLSQASDIYSLGITLFELLTCRVPFQANTPISIVQMQISQPLPPLHSYRADIPLHLEAALNKALAKNALDRFQTVDEFLDACMHPQPAAAGGATIVEATSFPQETIVEPIQGLRQTPMPGSIPLAPTGEPPKTRRLFVLPAAGCALLILLAAVTVISVAAGWISLPFSLFPSGSTDEQQPVVIYVTSTRSAESTQTLEAPAQTSPTVTSPEAPKPSATEPLEPVQAPTATDPSPPTETDIPTAIPEKPTLTLDRNVFCYQNPDKNSEQHWTLNRGDTVLILGASPNNWWLVAIDDDRTRTKCCWVNDGTTSGDLQIVPNIGYEIDRMNCPPAP